MDRVRADRTVRAQVERVEAFLPAEAKGPPVLVFNASTRINTLSLNAAFSLLTSWSLRATGASVQHVVCRAGLQQCMLGTHWSDLTKAPPCRECVRFSELLDPRALSQTFELDGERVLLIAGQLNDLSLNDLKSWSYSGLELGRLCLPTVRWALRQHRLVDDEQTRGLFRQYLISAANLADEFKRILDDSMASAVVVFNGITYPEAVARELALARRIPVITHEVGLRPLSAFFSHLQATFREVEVPSESELPLDWNSKLDSYLAERLTGKFSMAGVRFWPEIEPLPSWLVARMARFKRMVPVFTNVIFDTSQVHADTLFSSMFDWLDTLRNEIANQPETLFVIRAHPDEDRPGKASRESVADWFTASGLGDQENVAFLAPGKPVSSYELIERASCVLVYNSSVGLEAAIAGKPVLCAGRARYSQAGAAYYPSTREDYRKDLKRLVAADRPEVPGEFALNGRRFLYQELFRESLDFSEFLRPHPTMPGMVLFNEFELSALAEHSALEVVRRGILEGKPFHADQRVVEGRG